MKFTEPGYPALWETIRRLKRAGVEPAPCFGNWSVYTVNVRKPIERYCERSTDEETGDTPLNRESKTIQRGSMSPSLWHLGYCQVLQIPV